MALCRADLKHCVLKKPEEKVAAPAVASVADDLGGLFQEEYGLACFFFVLLMSCLAAFGRRAVFQPHSEDATARGRAAQSWRHKTCRRERCRIRRGEREGSSKQLRDGENPRAKTFHAGPKIIGRPQVVVGRRAPQLARRFHAL